MLCAGLVLNQLICLFAVVLLQAVINVLALLPYPAFHCLVHAFLDFLVNCSVLCHSISIYVVLLFLSFLRLAHRSRMSVVTQGFLTGRYLKRISLAVSVTAVLKVSINISMSMSESRMEGAANFPLIFAWKISAISGSFSFSRSNLILVLHVFFSPSSDVT